MTTRINKTYLLAQVERLNRITGNAIEGRKSGTYSLSIENGGYNLYQFDDGGQRNVFSIGHVAPKLLSQLIDAYIHGVVDTKT